MGENVNDLPLWRDKDARKILTDLCEQHRVPVDALEDLVSLQRERQHQERAHGVIEAITEILDRME